MLQIQLLGEFRLTADGLPVTSLNTLRLQTLLAYLTLHRGAAQSRQQLAYLFWPDSSDSQARTNLRNALFQLRNALPAADTFLQVETQTIQWRADAPFVLDVAQFETALDEAQQATATTLQQAALARAVAAYGGDLLPGSYDDWLLQERERLQQRFMTTLEALISLLESQQEYRLAIDYAQRLLQQDPLRETTYARLMQLYALAGDRAAALRVYHTCTTTLARELEVDPDPQTRSVYEHLLNLEAPQPTVSRLRDASPLIGRQAAWNQLQESWRQAARGHPSLLLVTGEAGIGKTRLVEELVEWAQRQGVATGTAHCYAVGGNLALAAVQEWLRAPFLRRARQELEPLWAGEVARLLPELLVERPGLPPPAPMLESWQRQRFFDALARLLLFSREPLLLVLDDIQWCDQETIEWVQFLLRSNAQARLLIVSTLRQEVTSADQLLAPFLQHLARSGQVVQLELGRLTREETAQLAANLLGRALSTELADHVYDDSEGNPLFVVEMVRAQLSPGPSEPARPLTAAPNGGDSPVPQRQPSAAPFLPGPPTQLPAKVLSVIQSRLAGLTPQARDLANVAAVIGRAFSVEVLARAAESDEDQLVQGLDELWQQRVIREHWANPAAAEWYDFTHDKIREVAYASLSPVRRRHLHRRVAGALEQVYAGHLDAVHAQIATQYEAAGQAARAIAALLQAAEAARQRSAFAEAIRYLRHALGLLAATGDGSEAAARELAIQVALGPLLLATKGYAAPEVERAFTRAWELCRTSREAGQRFQVLWWLSRFYLVQPNLARGLEVSQQLRALAAAAGDPGLLLEANFALGTYEFHRGAFAAARQLLAACLADFEPERDRAHSLSYGHDPWVVGSAYLSWTLWCLGEPALALAQTAAGLARAEAIDHPYSQVAITTYAAVQQQFRNEPAQCQRYAEQAIALADQYGFSLWLSMATFLRGWAQTMFGHFDPGFDDMQRSIDLYRQSGGELGADYFMALLADTFGRAGQADVGLLLMQQAFDLLDRTQARWCEAELHRLHGGLYQRAGQLDQAAAAYQSAIQVARRQQARQLELRASVSLAQLQQEGEEGGSLEELAALMASLGVDNGTPEYQAAQRLLTSRGH